MATLNLSKMKYMSETNLKKFASLIISLSSQVTDVENKCIKPYVDGELYPRDSYVSHDGYIYMATATNQDSAFDETHWDKLSDDFNELTVADIEAMLGLSQEQLETMANLIADTEVRLDKTYSSSKIYQDIQQCLNDSKSYTLKEIAKLNGSSYKVVSSTSEMTSESIIYLLTSGNTYDMYIVEENGATTKIGDMNIDLSQYVKVTDLENDYLKKADADGKYATIATVDGKIDKDKIVTVLDDTVTDEQVPSAKVIQEELDKKIGKDNLVTVLDDTVTDEQILNALALKELLDEKNVENLFPIQYYNNISDTRTGITATINDDRSITFKGTTTGQYFFVLWHKDNNGLGKAVALRGKTITMTGGLASLILSLAFYDEEGNDVTPPDNAMKYDYGDGLTIKVPDNAYSVYSYYYSSANKTLDCTVYPMLEIGNVAHDYCPPNGTAVADVPVTPINIINGMSNPDCRYQVKNGICYIYFNSGTYNLGGNVNGLQLSRNMPIPASGNVYHTYVPWASNDASKQVIVLVDGSGKLLLHAPAGANRCNVFCSFSYPVTE